MDAAAFIPALVILLQFRDVRGDAGAIRDLRPAWQESCKRRPAALG